MAGLFSIGSFKGVGMIVLQILRIFTVISLTSSAVSCWAMVLRVPKDKTYFVFEAASLVSFSFICAFLVFSEFPVTKFVRNFYRRNWALFSDQSGQAWLGIAVCLIGFNLLGKLNQPDFESNKIPYPVWQLTLAAGILDLVFGVLNVLCALTWMDRKEGVTAKDVRSKGSLAKSQTEYLPEFTSRGSRNSRSVSSGSSIQGEKAKKSIFAWLWSSRNQGNGQIEEGTSRTRPTISGPIAANHRQHDIERDAPDANSTHDAMPVIPDSPATAAGMPASIPAAITRTMPGAIPADTPEVVHDRVERRGAPTSDDYGIDSSQYEMHYAMQFGNDRQSPIAPGVRRPQSALHPLFARNSRYSVATGLTRF